MQILLLVTGGRGGSDFFQGLFDNHSQILQFPGKLIIDENFLPFEKIKTQLNKSLKQKSKI